MYFGLLAQKVQNNPRILWGYVQSMNDIPVSVVISPSVYSGTYFYMYITLKENKEKETWQVYR